MGVYKKAFVALAGVVAMLVGVPVAGLEAATATLVEAILGILTVFGVYQVTNRDPDVPVLTENVRAGRNRNV